MQMLEQWLSVATRGLCESAADRVRAEIGEHYLSALEALGTTVEPVDAERRAVAALGDAKTANREYRRVLLIHTEDTLLRGLTSRKRWVWAGSFFLLMTSALVFIPDNALGYTKYMLSALVVDLVLQAVPVGLSRVGWMVRGFRWGILTLGLTMSFVSALGDGFAYVPGIISGVVSIVHIEYKLFVIRRKLPVEQWPSRLWV